MSNIIARLTRKLDVDNRIDLRFYYRIADDLLRTADICRDERNIIDLYVVLLRFSSLIIETIPDHEDYRLSSRSERKHFKSKLLSALAELETFKPDVARRLAEMNRNPSIDHPQRNRYRDPYVPPPVGEMAPFVEQHLQENDLNTTPSRNLVSIPQPPAPQTVPRSSHVANSAPEQPLVHRTMPVPTSQRASTSSANIIVPISIGISSSIITELYMTDTEHIELARAIIASIECAIAEGVHIEPYLVQETGRTSIPISINDLQPSDTYINYPSDASPNQATAPRTILNNTAAGSNFEKREVVQNGLCIVCFDSQIEAACIPCGHMAGCLACFKKIEAESKKCPVCRATVTQVVKIYTI